jgi:hypothetical protein
MLIELIFLLDPNREVLEKKVSHVVSFQLYCLESSYYAFIFYSLKIYIDWVQFNRLLLKPSYRDKS